MSGWNRGERSPLRRGLLAGIVTMLGLVVFRSCVGCSQTGPKADDRTKQGGQLAARLAGEWVSKDDETVTVFFTNGSNKLVYSHTEKVKLPMQSRLDPPVYTGEMKKHNDTHEIESFRDSSMKIRTSFGELVIEFEFSSDDEFMAVYKSTHSHDPKIKGRFRRAVPRSPTPTPDSSPIAVAKLQVQRIEQKLKKHESLRGDAAKERDEMVVKLRDLGVESAADLKRNPRAMRMGENLAKLAAEIEGMDSQLATIDTELLKARAIARRMEQEQAGISDDEMRQLSQQLREAEARTDTAPRPITPLDVDAAVEAALKGRKSSPREKR